MNSGRSRPPDLFWKLRTPGGEAGGSRLGKARTKRPRNLHCPDRGWGLGQVGQPVGAGDRDRLAVG